MNTHQALICPVCEAQVEIASDCLNGELVTCLSCGTDLEVTISDTNVKLSPAPEVEEDWGE